MYLLDHHIEIISCHTEASLGESVLYQIFNFRSICLTTDALVLCSMQRPPRIKYFEICLQSEGQMQDYYIVFCILCLWELTCFSHHLQSVWLLDSYSSAPFLVCPLWTHCHSRCSARAIVYRFLIVSCFCQNQMVPRVSTFPLAGSWRAENHLEENVLQWTQRPCGIEGCWVIRSCIGTRSFEMFILWVQMIQMRCFISTRTIY